jgi:hypothetical protein
MEPPPGFDVSEDRIRADLRARTLELRAARRRIRALELAGEGADPPRSSRSTTTPGTGGSRG